MKQNNSFSSFLSALNEDLNVEQLQQSIIRWAVELFQVFAGEIHLWDEEAGVLRHTFPVGSEQYQHTVLRPGEGLTGRVFVSGEPRIINDYNQWEGRSNIYQDVPENTTVLAVPMKIDDRVIGVLDLSSNGEVRPFNEDDLPLATLFANLSAVALEIARIHEVFRDQSEEMKSALEREVALRTAELEYRARQMSLSAQVSRNITSNLNIDTLLDQVVHQIQEAFGYYAVQIFILDESGKILLMRATSLKKRSRSRLGKISLNVGQGSLNGQAAKERQGQFSGDVSKEEDYFQSSVLPATKSELVVPLVVGDKLIGTLDVQSDQLDAFNQQDLQVFQSLADQIAIAIENAYHMERVKQIAMVEERERIAHELQDAITQTLLSASLIADALPDVMASDPEEGHQLLKRQSALSRGALENMQHLNKVFELPLHFDLTRREYEVLTLMVGGSGNQEIAERLNITRSTVKTHVSHILSKLGVSNRMEAISFVLMQSVDQSRS